MNQSPMRQATLQNLTLDLPVRLSKGAERLSIHAIVEDSRLCTPGCLFVARPGAKVDGRDFIADAIERGATAVLTDAGDRVPANVARIETRDVTRAAAIIAERLAGSPSSKLKLLGVTGTNGKTTTTHLIRHIANAAGFSCGLIGTIEVDDGRHTAPASLTTPDAVFISGRLAAMTSHDCAACAMEVSSHALQQNRVAGLQFTTAVFTNLTGDHLDYHGSMEEYAAAKAKLFKSLAETATAIVNGDDPNAARMARDCRANVIECSLERSDATCSASVLESTPASTKLVLRGPWGKVDVTMPLVGRHNAMNALQAAAACWSIGIESDALLNGLYSCTAPPGRLEIVTSPTDKFAVIVDYAHTDDALKNVLEALRPIVSAGAAMRVVFGCGGDRDRSKRPRMAAIACSLAHDVIITSDNPRTERPAAIIDDVLKGVPANREAITTAIEDRREAIRTAISRAQPGDVVLIAGKGHEDYQIIGTTMHPFDDRLIARETLMQRGVCAAGAR